MIERRPISSLLACALLIGSAANAQIRDDLDYQQKATGTDVDAAIAESERFGEHDSKERRDLILATQRWYGCAKRYADVLDRRDSAVAMTHDDALIAVLSCAEERAEVIGSARAYSTANGTPRNADLKARSIEYSLRGRLAERLATDVQWEINQQSDLNASNQ